MTTPNTENLNICPLKEGLYGLPFHLEGREADAQIAIVFLSLLGCAPLSLSPVCHRLQQVSASAREPASASYRNSIENLISIPVKLARFHAHFL